MDFDQLLIDSFGTSDLSAVPPDQVLAGIEKLRTRFGLEAEADDRFAVWCLLCMLGAAPDVDEAFASDEDREAAREFADSIDEDEDE